MHEAVRNWLIGQGWVAQQGDRLVLTPQADWRQQGEQMLVALAGWGYLLSPAGFGRLLSLRPGAALPPELLVAQPYRLRRATLADLEALVAIEAATWPAALRASPAELRQRVERYPEGQVLGVLEQRVVGLICSQRIADARLLLQSDFRAAAALHDPAGRTVQLLAVNVLPEVQDQGLGDQLLEFVLQCCTLRPDVERVVGVTRCKAYPQHAELGMEAYARLRGARGQYVDPVLNFHALHGARVGRVIAGYRPPDQENLGTGVLVEYDDLPGRLARLSAAMPATLAGPAAGIAALVDQAVREVLGARRAAGYTRGAPLREQGLDSVELLELRVELAQRLGRALEPTIFFRYPTPEALIGYLEQAASADAEPAEPPDLALPPQAHGDAPEPIAIIGMACRFPGGVSSPAAFWELLTSGTDAIGPVPPARWDMAGLYGDQPGQIRTRYGGFLDQVDGFDAAFFQIGPLEASAMDPQQRLLLETHWEALERAGINPETLKGSPTGIYVGVFGDDYKLLQARQADLGVYYGTGTSNAATAGRLAYVLGTAGPAMAVDTACSASLVALHLACQSLRAGESRLALASGVNLLLSPELSIAFSQANMLAPDGRCKAFDAAADGYVRSEGCAVVVLKRLADARAAGDPVLALIRATAINQDGASNGLTAPNGLAQEALIRQALATAGLQPRDVDYVEAHGTGTALGDPIEVQALEAVYGQGRAPEHPLIVGSVKTNIGHTEAAAGLAGLLKVLLALQHGFIPPHLHLTKLNPHLADARIRIPTSGCAWPASDPARPRRAAVSSFGFSGTNAHAILEAAPPPAPEAQPPQRPCELLTLSAQSEPALRALAQQYAAALAGAAEADLAAVAATTRRGRAHLRQRLALVAASLEEARAQLAAVCADQSAPRLCQGTVAAAQSRPMVAFLFTGQGAQYLGMGRELFMTEPLFRERLERCDQVLRACLGRSLLELLYPDAPPDHNDLLESHPCGQAVNFALECALADLWRSWGVQPDVVLGHSLGDFAAAYTAGVITLEDGLRLVIERGRLMETAQGSMLAVQASEADVTPLLADCADVTIGVINGPRSLVLSGARAGVARVAARLQQAGFKTRLLDIPVAAHSPLLDPALDAFTAAVRQARLHAPRIAVVSSMTGQQVTHELTDPHYWRQHLRNTIRFGAGVLTLERLGCRIFVEIGPKQTLLGIAGQVLDELPGVGEPALLLPSLRDDLPDTQQMLLTLAALYARGVAVDWEGFDRNQPRRTVALPTYPFQRQRFWIEPGGQRSDAVPSGFAQWLAGQTVEQLTGWVAEQAALGPAEQQIAARVLATLAAQRERQQAQAQVEPLLYELVWEPGRPRLAAPAPPGHWLILADAGGLALALAELLRGAGQTVELASDVAGLLERLAGLAGQPPAAPLRGVVHLCALDHPEGAAQAFDSAALAAIQEQTLGSLLRLVQALAGLAGQAARLWVVTRAAQQLDPAEPLALAQTPLWGLGRVIAQEHAELWGGLVDVDPAGPPAGQASALLAELLQPQPDLETEVAYRQGVRHVARLARARLEQAPPPVGIRADALYLITGGLGALGLRIAAMLADQGAQHLLLLSRRGTPDQPAQAAIARLEARGVSVRCVQADVADAAAMRQLLAAIAVGPQPLKGVFHSAGVLDDGIVLNQTWQRFVPALAAKVSGSWLLHQLTQDLELDLLVFCSSLVALLGNAGQASYAAANAFQDGLARLRRQQGRPGLSINWGIWAEAGMAMRGETLAFAGVQPMPPALAIQALERLLPHAGQIAVAQVDWAAVAAAGRGARALLARLAPAAADVSASPGPRAALLEQLAALPPNQRLPQLRSLLQQLLARLLGRAEPPDTQTGFADLGLDSLLALELRRQLERALACKLPSTVAFEYPTLEALARYLLSQVLVLAEPAPAPADPPAGERSGADEPIAVISMACRFPGADTPEAFWHLLQQGRDMVREIPATRWDVQRYYNPQRPLPGHMYVREAAFVDQAEQFDPLFFGIAPREVASMDPQHWLLLEVSWEVLERAGLAQSRLIDSRTGVFVGIGVGQYGSLEHPRDLAELDHHAITSGGHSVAAGRLAYLLGLQGPTLAVDTACSSSLVALHLACQSLRAGECDLALAGGVNLMLSPLMHVALSQMQVLAPDGRCKAFDAAADGYGRGEGGAMVLLKRLSAAQRDGDPILAVIAGSAINHDGLSSGLTVPNKRAQEKLLRQALANARVAPDALAYVETHGTGTPLGDPIELRALGAVFGAQRPFPLLVGTVKSNIGHLEAAAGIAGLIKTVLALQHGQIPRQLHFQRPNPYIEWDEFAIEVPTSARPWPGPASARRLAGVSSFGISGTNAHVIVASAPPQPGAPPASPDDPPQARPRQLLTLSAKSPAALTALLERYREHVRCNPTLDLADLCHTAALGRNHFGQRLAIVADSVAGLASSLQAALDGVETPAIVRGSLGHAPPRLALLFTGQGTQYVAMGRELYATQPTFRATLERCDTLLRAHLGESLLALLYPSPAAPDDPRIHQTGWTQPALFALEYALATLWLSWGLQPDVLIGHSVGELVAACVAGVFSLEDGLRLIAARGRLMDALPQDGEMAALMADEATVLAMLAPYRDALAIAALNGPQSVVISGRRAAVRAVVAEAARQGIKSRALTVSHAFHSPLMDPILEPFRAVAASVSYQRPRLALVSNLTGALAGAELLGPDYWVRHVREPVRFADGVTTLLEQGCQIFLEIGPHPTLLGMAGNHGAAGSVAMLPSLWRGLPDWQPILGSLAELYVRGVPIDWQRFDQDPRRRRVVLPTYPFQRAPYWANKPEPQHAAAPHPLIERVIRLPLHDETVFETHLSLAALPFLAQHRVYGALVSPGACQLAIVLGAAGLLAGPGQALGLREVLFPRALVLPEQGQRTLQTLVGAAQTNGHGPQSAFKLISFDPAATADEPVIHATGLLTPPASAGAGAPDLAALRRHCHQPGLVEPLYARAAAAQIELGPWFRWIAEVWHAPAGAPPQALARLVTPAGLATGGHPLHPGLLDACFQVAALARADAPGDATLLPFALDALRLHLPARGETWWCHAVLVGGQTWDIRLLDEQGELLVEIDGFAMRAATPEAVRQAEVWRSWLYQVVWQPSPLPGRGSPHLPDPAGLAQELQTALPAHWSALDAERHQTCMAALEELSVAYVLAAFANVGFTFLPGTHWRSEQIARQIGVIPSYQRLLERLLAILAEAGLLRQEQGGWRVLRAPQPVDPAQQAAQIQAAHGTPPELGLLMGCGPRLSEVLRGVQEPLELLFPAGDTGLAHQLYAESPPHRLMNSLVQQALQSALARLPAGRGLRILEIGGGTGGTTAGLLPLLPPDQTEYLFTDIGLAFVAKAQARFANDPFVTCQTLDIEQDPAAQGVEPRQTDLVLAANVLHATSDLRQTLAHVRQVLQPGGHLLLLEVTRRRRWVDLTFGLTEGWWRFADQRQDHPLISAGEWRDLLQAQGFPQVEVVEQGDHALIIAQAATPEQAAPAPAAARRWLLFADRQGVAEALAARLRQQGDQPLLVWAAPADQPQADPAWLQIRPDCPADYQHLLATCPALHGVVHLWSLDTPAPAAGADLVAAAQPSCATLLHLAQALLQAARLPRGLWCVTRDAQAVAPGDPLQGLGQAGLWGMGRVIDQEHPELNCVRVDVGGADAPEPLAEQLCAEICSMTSRAPREKQVALRGGARLVARLTRFTPQPAAEIGCDPAATYLITGGLGGLGMATAAWLVAQGARRLILAGRSLPGAQVQAQVTAWADAGVQVTLAQCDVTRRADLQRLIDQIDPRHPLRGVVHAVGVLDDGALLHQSWARFAGVLAPKVQGAWHLHELTSDLPLEFFVLFSAAAGLLGNRGQANHAAANTFLDALAAFRRAQGRPGLALDWGAWSEIGAAAELMRQQQAELVARGLGAMPPQQALRALAGLLGQPAAQVAVLAIAWPTFLQAETARLPFFAAFLDTLAPAHPPVSPHAGAPQPAMRPRLEQAAPEQRPALLAAWLQQIVARILHLPEPPHPQVGFGELGMDSLMTIELRRKLEHELALSLPSTIVFEHPSVEALGRYLLRDALLLADDPRSPPADAPPATDLASLSDAELNQLLAQELALLDE